MVASAAADRSDILATAWRNQLVQVGGDPRSLYPAGAGGTDADGCRITVR